MRFPTAVKQDPAVAAWIRQRSTRMVALLADLDRGNPAGESTDIQFGAVLRIWEPALNRSVDETLKVKRLDLISNNDLRLRIVSLYERLYSDVEHSEADDRASRDPYFRNLVEYRLESLRSNEIGSFEPAIKEVDGLIGAVDATIGR